MELGAAVSATGEDGEARTSVVTDPPSDLLLAWDTSGIAGDSVDIVLAEVVGEDELREMATVGTQSNTGGFVVDSATLEGFDFSNDTIALFKVCLRAAQLFMWYVCVRVCTLCLLLLGT